MRVATAGAGSGTTDGKSQPLLADGSSRPSPTDTTASTASSGPLPPLTDQEVQDRASTTCGKDEVCLRVDGMTCGSCELTVFNALRDLPIVQDVRNVDFQLGAAKVRLKTGSADSMQAQYELLCDTIDCVGFDCAVWGA